MKCFKDNNFKRQLLCVNIWKRYWYLLWAQCTLLIVSSISHTHTIRFHFRFYPRTSCFDFIYWWDRPTHFTSSSCVRNLRQFSRNKPAIDPDNYTRKQIIVTYFETTRLEVNSSSTAASQPTRKTLFKFTARLTSHQNINNSCTAATTSSSSSSSNNNYTRRRGIVPAA